MGIHNVANGIHRNSLQIPMPYRWRSRNATPGLPLDLAAILSGDCPTGAHRLDLLALLELSGPNALTVEDIARGGRDLVHRAADRYAVYGEHAQLDVLV